MGKDKGVEEKHILALWLMLECWVNSRHWDCGGRADAGTQQGADIGVT